MTMTTTTSTKLCLGLLSANLLFFSCGNPSTEKHNHEEHAATESTTVASPSAESTSNDLLIEGDDQMKFNQSEFKVKVGEPINLTLRHSGKLAKEVMGHNLVVLKSGTDVDAFAKAALQAKDDEYIPTSLSDAIISHTALVGGGEASTISFTLAEAGTYDFICSFPGHAALMKGIIIAE